MSKSSKIAATLAVLAYLAAGVFLPPENLEEKPPDTLPAAVEAAFVKLDMQIAKCTFSRFVFDTDPTAPAAPLFDHLGEHHFKISTSVPRAQVFFDQGLRLAHAFNHAEAHRSFVEAARLDPSCAMAYWGQAYVLGPNINDPMPDEERRQKAREAADLSLKYAGQSSALEQALIRALDTRYSAETGTAIDELNTRYAGAMRAVAERYADDPEVLTLYADALMNTMPWNYWDASNNPNPGTLEAKAALEKAIALNSRHPGAHHFYIHIVEKPDPDLGVPSADVLGSLMPGAGHIVHMPAHIYIRVGRYKDAARVNVEAVNADEDYIAQCYAQGVYPLAYYPHNIHFIWASATNLGDSHTALQAARKVAEKVPVSELKAIPFLQDFASTPMQAYVRFGLWDEILTIPYPGDDLKHYRIIWHYARGMAFVRKQRLESANRELTALQKLGEDPELATLMASMTNPSSSILQVARAVLQGEIAAAEGDHDGAIGFLTEAVKLEDQLVYSEPPPWHIPCRQNLGAVLLKAGKAKEAEDVYREELNVNRENGWSLMGLRESLRAQGNSREADIVSQRFDKAWEAADIRINTSVL
jgi:tetratricopeptide (TPR) repeat protein